MRVSGAMQGELNRPRAHAGLFKFPSRNGPTAHNVKRQGMTPARPQSTQAQTRQNALPPSITLRSITPAPNINRAGGRETIKIGTLLTIVATAHTHTDHVAPLGFPPLGGSVGYRTSTPCASQS